MKKLILVVILFCTLQSAPSFAQSGRIGTPWPYPAFQDNDGPSCSLATAATPVILMAPMPDAVPPPRPPAPARPVLHEYQWPAQPSLEANPGTYLLVLTDSTVRRAVALWQQDGALHFLLPDRTSVVVRFDAIDREATQRVNAERGLTVHLPGNPRP